MEQQLRDCFVMIKVSNHFTTLIQWPKAKSVVMIGWWRLERVGADPRRSTGNIEGEKGGNLLLVKGTAPTKDVRPERGKERNEPHLFPFVFFQFFFFGRAMGWR